MYVSVSLSFYFILPIGESITFAAASDETPSMAPLQEEELSSFSSQGVGDCVQELAFGSIAISCVCEYIEDLYFEISLLIYSSVAWIFSKRCINLIPERSHVLHASFHMMERIGLL